MISSLTTKAQTTVPAEIREQLNLQAGSKFRWRVLGNGRIELEPLTTGNLLDLVGIVKPLSQRTDPVTLDEMDDAIAEGAAESMR